MSDKLTLHEKQPHQRIDLEQYSCASICADATEAPPYAAEHNVYA